MSVITDLLNKLSLYSYRDSSSRLASAVGLILLGLVFVLCWLMSAKVERKLAFTIDELTLGGAKSVTFGENSDFCVKNVPRNFLTVNYLPEQDCFSWTVNRQYHDSLQYFKINNENPNKHAIRDDEAQVVSLRLPVSEGDTLRANLTGADIWSAWEHFDEQKDVMARHLAAYIKLSDGKATAGDSTRYLAQMQRGAVRSFFDRQGDAISLVILDELTSLSDQGKTVGFRRSGTVPATDGGGRLKVQFFGLADWCYMDGSSHDGYFRVDGVNYVMKPSVKLTEWGAGHATVFPVEEGLRITFPKPITYVGSVDSLRKKAGASSKTLTVKQLNNSYPTKSDLYLPAFSSAINFDLCNIEFFHQKDSVCIRGNNDAAQLVENAFHLFPVLQPAILHSGKDTLKCRVGYVDGLFILSYMWLPLGVFLVLMLLVWLKSGPVYVRNATDLYNPMQIDHYRPYLALLLTVCLAYCGVKSLIVLKLSYSYPYFEKLTAIIPFSTSLMMLLFFSLSMLLNTPLRLYATRNRPLLRAGHWLTCAVLMAVLAGLFFLVSDRQVSQSVIDSYFHGEVYDIRPWKWLSAYGINDTHRSVVYALLFVEALALLMWLLADLFWAWLSGWWQDLSDRWATMSQEWADGIARQWSRLTKGWPTRCILAAVLALAAVIVQFHLGFNVWLLLASVALVAVVWLVPFVCDAFTAALRSLFPTHLMLFVLLYLIGKVSGNFGTAFITLIVIIGMTKALTSVRMDEGTVPRHMLFSQMLLISVAYIAAAMVGDHGYMTNYLGFVMCLVCFFFLMERPPAYDDSTYQIAEKEKWWVYGSMTLLVVLLMAMPYICSQLFSPEQVNYDRLARRVMLYSNFDELEQSGYRYSESDAEFMVIMNHYMRPGEGHDPLSNDDRFLHTSISSGQSPVVLNDLSLPAAFFGAYGIYVTTAVYFLLLFVIMWLVMQFSLSSYDEDARLTRAMQWRLLAMMMWVGTSFYIYLSYIGRLPFTGRLNPGLGVDAVGEALETAILLAFMAAVTCRETSSGNEWY